MLKICVDDRYYIEVNFVFFKIVEFVIEIIVVVIFLGVDNLSGKVKFL